jgi:predicted HAD superfamily phosphohydrolase YqeG
MILYQNAFMRLDYDPAADILIVEWPDFRPYTLTSVKEVLRILVETVRDYDIKKLLADSSNTIIEVDEADYKSVMENFALAIRTTRLQKMARIVTADPLRENIVVELKENVGASVIYKSFTSRAAALEWLK